MALPASSENSGDESYPDLQRVDRGGSAASLRSLFSDEGEPLLPGHRRTRHLHTISKDESVYTAATYFPALAQPQIGKLSSRETRQAFLLVALNFVLQLGVVRILDLYTERDLRTMRNLVIQDRPVATTFDNIYDALLLPHEKIEMETSGSKGLCTIHGNLSCMPASIRYVQLWSELDTNGDGIWSRAEAEFLEKSGRHVLPPSISGTEAASPVFLYDAISKVFQRHLHSPNSNKTLYISKVIQMGIGIPRAYFDYWAGDAMFCTRFDKESCREIVASGIFTDALGSGRPSAAQKGIEDLSSAYQYCEKMLADGGSCEHILPASFQENRAKRWAMCGTRESLGNAWIYSNPHDTEERFVVLSPTYSHLSLRLQAGGFLYLCLSVLILMTFWASMLPEVRHLMKYADFLMNFPNPENDDMEKSQGSLLRSSTGAFTKACTEYGGDEMVVITGITSVHRAFLVIVWILRISVFVITVRFGTMFLVAEPDWVTLVGKTLALAFIMQTDEMLFASMIDQNLYDQLEHTEPMQYTTSFPDPHECPWTRYFMRKEAWGMVLLPPLTILTVWLTNVRIGMPLVEALTCACTMKGERCQESAALQLQWWDHYWSKQLPSALQQINAMYLMQK